MLDRLILELNSPLQKHGFCISCSVMDTKVYPIHIHRKYHDIYTKSLDTDITQLKYQDTWRKSAFNKEKGLRENLKSKLLTNQFDSGIKMEHSDRDRERKAIKTT